MPHFDEICDLFRQYGVSYAALFGSRASGENTPDSDYDFLIEFAPRSRKTLSGMIELTQKLEDIVKQKVDLVTKEGLSKYIKPYIQDNLQIIYEKKS